MPSALCPTTLALADSEPQALGEDFFARGAVVNWRRERSGHTWSGAKAEGGFIAFCALSDCHCASEGAGLALYPASAVTERSTEEFEGTATGIAKAGLIA